MSERDNRAGRGRDRRDDARPERGKSGGGARSGSGGGSRPPRDGARGKPRPDGRPGGARPPRRDGDTSRPPRREGDATRPPRRDGESPRPPRRDGQAPRPPRRDGDRPPRRDDSRDSRPERAPLTPEQLRFRELRSVRPEHEDPPIAEGVSWMELAPPVRYELKSLSVDNAEFVGNHLAMAARLIDSDPELAHQHALSAYRRGGRLGVVRETVGLTAYTKGDFALALREFQTYRRLTGSDEQIGAEVDCERGLGRPERGLERARAVDRKKLSPAAAVQLAIALSGARLDQGKPLLALAELEIPQLTPDTVFEYSPALFDAYAEVLEELGRHDEAKPWRKRAVIAQQALDEAYGVPEEGEEFEVVTEYEPADEE